MDYGALSTTVMFGACQTQECVDITIEDDVVLENVESFFVNLSRSPGLDSRITLNPTRAEVQIIDNEGYCVYNSYYYCYDNPSRYIPINLYFTIIIYPLSILIMAMLLKAYAIYLT